MGGGRLRSDRERLDRGRVLAGIAEPSEYWGDRFFELELELELEEFDFFEGGGGGLLFGGGSTSISSSASSRSLSVGGSPSSK